MEAWQDYEAPKEELPAAHKQNSSIQRNMPATKQVEYQSSGQPSLRTMEHPTWCSYERGNPRVVIFGHGILSQDLELARSVLTEPTRAAPRYHTNSEQRTEGQLQTQKEFRHEELQEGPLLRKHLKLLHSYGISTTFNLDDSKKHESNAELRTILFKEGGIDAIIDSPQSKAKEEKHNCIIALAKPIEPIELADFCLKTKEDHFQIGLNNNMEAWQDYEAPKEELPAAHKQNSSIQRNMPATKQVEYQSSG
ncbi:uncharacterized protein LOC130828714 [Amaranthus tricolor]|uniref:uncharacterized protein LOC130828714 n=1 Tax=Amaranthus tricolor TaxID=29722 RepID=UPI0025867BFE|nr:uncharacterized protein LOC130828714 [Amaranthus tricolor]